MRAWLLWNRKNDDFGLILWFFPVFVCFFKKVWWFSSNNIKTCSQDGVSVIQCPQGGLCSHQPAHNRCGSDRTPKKSHSVRFRRSIRSALILSRSGTFWTCCFLLRVFSIPPTSWGRHSNQLPCQKFYTCATSFVFSILTTHTHQSGFWTVDGWALRQLLLFFIIFNLLGLKKYFRLVQWHPLHFL